jgi:hypothetical protein
MRIRLVIVLMLTAVCLLPVVTEVSTARQADLNYMVYLPIVARNSPCVPKGTTAYVATSKPVVRVGEIITVTGALVNECNPLVGEPFFGVLAEPSGILSPTHAERYSWPPEIHVGEYEEVTFTLQAVGSGVVTVTSGALYETTYNCNPPGFCYNNAVSSPTVVRVLPNP